MRIFLLLLLLGSVLAACGGPPHASNGPDHKFEEPEKYVAQWNAPERDEWQKPDEIVQALNLEPGHVVADLGAGTGYLLPFLSRAVGAEGRVFAVDIEPAMIDYLDQAIEKEGWSNVETHLGGPEGPRLRLGSVDRVVTLNVWHHIHGRSDYASKLAEALAPGAVVLVVDYLPEETPGFGPPLTMRLPAEEIVKDFEAAGFRAEIVTETLPRQYIVRATRGD